MADISKVKLPNGITYNIKDTVSGYTKNTGTVTSVGLSNATNSGLSITGSPITSSGSITVGHSNVLSSAQSTQAVYPITIDKNGHVASYGTAVTVPTVTSSYSSTGTDAVNGTAVNAALQTLDSSIASTTGQAISAITITDGKITSSSKISVGETNQNAFSNVKVGSTTIAADTTTDTLELVAGTGITLTPDATNDKVTIASTASGDNSYRITLSYDSANDSFSTDKTYAEIVAAINSGKQAYIYDNTGYHKYTIGSYQLGLTDIFAWCVSTGAVGAGALYNLNFTCYNLLLKAEIVYMIDSSNNVSTTTDSMGASSAVTDVRINNNSIVTTFGSSRIANFSTNTAYNSSTNKIATMSDVPPQLNWYGSCSTVSSTAEKSVSCSGYTLNNYNIIVIAFGTDNPVYGSQNITFNVNSTGAKQVIYNGDYASSTNPLLWSSGDKLVFMYLGSAYIFLNRVADISPLTIRTWS